MDLLHHSNGRARGVASDSELSPLARILPLCDDKDYEAKVNQSLWPVGIDENYPAELREMISAATITYFLQNKSIDYTRRIYAASGKYPYDPLGESRIDRKIKKICIETFQNATDEIRVLSESGLQNLIGEFACVTTLMRCGFSLSRAFAEADKGALYECVAIGRMILEKISWAYTIVDEDDFEKIKAVKASRSISNSARLDRRLGKLYGWLSSHVHWEYEAHVKSINQIGNGAAVTFRSCEFKAISYAVLITLLYFSNVLLLEIKKAVALHSFCPAAEDGDCEYDIHAETFLEHILQNSGDSELQDVQWMLNLIRKGRLHG